MARATVAPAESHRSVHVLPRTERDTPRSGRANAEVVDSDTGRRLLAGRAQSIFWYGGSGQPEETARSSGRVRSEQETNVPRRAHSKHLPILQKVRKLSDLVVKGSCSRVVLVRQPIDPIRTGQACRLADGLDQRPPHATTSRCVSGKEILEIAPVPRGPGASMKDIVGNPDELPIQLGAKTPNRLVRVNQTSPSGDGDGCRNGCFVECQIPLPEGLPAGSVAGPQRPYGGVTHWGSVR